MVPEADLERTDAGLVPRGEGWFVVNAREAVWHDGHFGAYTRFDGEPHFPQIGINIGVLQPGQPACMYHGENEQEDFLVLSGECLLLVEGRSGACGPGTSCTALHGRSTSSSGPATGRARCSPSAPARAAT